MEKLQTLALMATIAVVGASLIVQCGAPNQVDSSLSVESSRPAVDQGADLSGYNYAIDQNLYNNREFVDDDAVRQIILDDLRQLDSRTRVFTRYFTFTSLYNSGVPDNDLRIQKFGLSKLLNSLSYRRDIKNPVPVDAKETVFRIDLRDYGWRTSTWDFIVRSDPYSIFFRDRAESEINRQTRSRKAYVRADWFGFAGSQGRLYNLILDIPRNVRTLEFRLGVDSDRNIRAGRVMRAGFSKSLVSQHNRIVERHEGRFGYYYKSYDFEEPNGNVRRNIFEFPLGGDRFRSNGDFQTAGGEMIFRLPNGMQVYMLTDANGNRIDVAPIEVVSDDRRFQNHEVVNGLACMNCHNAGLKTAIDEIRNHVEQNSFAYSRFTVENVRALYAPQQALNNAYAQDMALWKETMGKIGYGNNVGYPIADIEPVIHLANWFDTELTVERAAAEVGMRADEFTNQLRRSGFLTRRLGILLQKNGRLRREIFEDNFFNLVRQFRLGSTFRNGSFNPYSAEPGEEVSAPGQETVAASLPDEAASETPGEAVTEPPVVQTTEADSEETDQTL